MGNIQRSNENLDGLVQQQLSRSLQECVWGSHVARENSKFSVSVCVCVGVCLSVKSVCKLLEVIAMDRW